MRKLGPTVAAVAAATAVLLPTGSAAADDDTPTRLVLTRAEPGAGTRTVTLDCDPPAGTHPDTASACEYLATIDELTLPEENPRVRCVRYHPVQFRAAGTLHGAPVSAERTYGCVVPELPPPWQF